MNNATLTWIEDLVAKNLSDKEFWDEIRKGLRAWNDAQTSALSAAEAIQSLKAARAQVVDHPAIEASSTKEAIENALLELGIDVKAEEAGPDPVILKQEGVNK